MPKKLLDREPTRDMLRAVPLAYTSCRSIWEVMFDAAPALPEDEEAVRLAQDLLSNVCAVHHAYRGRGECDVDDCIIARALLRAHGIEEKP